MSDLIERLNKERETLLRFKLVAGETVTNRVYSELVEAARIAADSMREAAAELERLGVELAGLSREYEQVCGVRADLTAENAALRADAGRYFTLELLAANGDVRIAFDEDGRVGVHLEEAAECADGSWFGDDLAAAVDAATRQITDTDAAIDAAIDSARAKESGDG